MSLSNDRGSIMDNEVVKVCSGRKKLPFKRIGRTFRLTDDEYRVIRPLIEAIKSRTDERYRPKSLPLDI